MKLLGLLTSLAALAAALPAGSGDRYNPACAGSDTSTNCGECCLVWSYAQNACVQAGRSPGLGLTCHDFFQEPFGSAAAPKGCDIWIMAKRKCEEWLDGHEDGFNQPDSGPDYLRKSHLSAWGTHRPTSTSVPATIETSTSVVFVTSVVPAEPSAEAADETEEDVAVVTAREAAELEETAALNKRMEIITVTATSYPTPNNAIHPTPTFPEGVHEETWARWYNGHGFTNTIVVSTPGATVHPPPRTSTTTQWVTLEGVHTQTWVKYHDAIPRSYEVVVSTPGATESTPPSPVPEALDTFHYG